MFKKQKQEAIVDPVTGEIIPSMDDYKEELEKSFKRLRVGDIVTATIVSVDEVEGALADLNYYAPGKISVDAFSADPNFAIMEEVFPGDEVSAMVVKTDDGAGNLVLSVKEAKQETVWKEFSELLKKKTPLKVKIKEAVNGGVICYYQGIRGFIPASKLALNYVEDTGAYVGKTVDAIIITADEENERLVLSCKELLLSEKEKQKEEIIERIAVGSIVNGTVTELKQYGAFVDIGDGVTGLLHISQICEKRLTHPKERLRVGDNVKVKIIKTDAGKVSLSMKELLGVLDKDVDSDEPKEYTDNGFSTGLSSLFQNIKLS